MTFVRAQIAPNGVYVMADWRLTCQARPVQPSILTGALKVWVVDPNVCLAYAGSRSVASPALRAVATRAAAGAVDSVVADLANATATGDAQFIVATHKPARIWEIKEGHARATSAAWLGDGVQLLNAYQQNFKEIQQAEPDGQPVVGGQYMQAFRKVVESGQFPTVGDMCVTVLPAEQGFEYGAQAHLFGDGRPIEVPSGAWRTVDVGDETSGAHGYTILASTSHPAIGVYFFFGRFGVLFAPGLFHEGKPYAMCSQDEFAERARTEWGVMLQPGISYNRHPA